MSITTAGNFSSVSNGQIYTTTVSITTSSSGPGFRNVSAPGVKEGDILLTVIDTSSNNLLADSHTFKMVVEDDDYLLTATGGISGPYLIVVLRPAT
jgi:hypothetical protein